MKGNVPRKLKQIAIALGALGVVAVAGTASGSAPIVSQLSPTSHANNGSVRITVTGSDFLPNATATLERPAGTCPTETSPAPSCGAITGTAVDVPSASELRATFDLNAAAPGEWSLKITNLDAGSVTCNRCFTITSPAPAATAVSPAGRAQGFEGTVTVTGTNFARGSKVDVTGAGVTVGDTEFLDNTHLRATIAVDMDAPTGSRAVTVTNADGASNACSCTLSILDGPRITSLNPAARGIGATDHVITVNGSGFAPGATVAFGLPQGAVGSNGVTSSASTFISSSQIRVSVTVSSAPVTGATAGPRDVTLTNPGGGKVVCLACFTVSPNPTVTALSKASRGQGATGEEIVLTGTGFQCTIDADFPGTVSFGAGITVTQKTCFAPPTKISVKIDIAEDAATGVRAVSVTNNDGGGAGSCPLCFTVNAGPKPTSATPNQVAKGSSGSVDVSGTGFIAGSMTFSVSGTGVAVGPATAKPSTAAGTPAAALTATVTVDDSAPVGNRDISVRNNDDGGIGRCVSCLKVTNVAPSIFSVAPSTAGRASGTKTVTIQGADFLNGAGVSFALPSTAVPGSVNGITVGTVTRRSDTELGVQITVASDATAGVRDITVSNPEGPSPALAQSVCPSCFTITPPPAFAAVGALSPASRGQGATDQNLEINGSNFGFGATVTFNLPTSGTNGVTVNSVNVTATKITASVTLSPDATTGARNVTVQNADGGTAICASCFAVTAKPLATLVNPASRGQGSSSQTVTITGENFQSGATLAFSGTGVTPSGVVVISSTQISALLTVASGAEATARDLTVSNPDAGTGVCTGCFRVNALATALSASPASRGQGAQAQKVTLNGTNFLDGATVTFAVPAQVPPPVPPPVNGVTVNSTTWKSATQIEVDVTISPTASTGARDVTVNNGDGTAAVTCSACFTVNAAPTFGAVSPASRGQGATDQVVDVTGTGFASGASLTLSGTGITVTPQSVTDTKITVKMTIDPAATIGPRDLSVVNGDGGRAGCIACFIVNARPAVTSISPASLGQKQASKDVTVDATGLQSGSLVSVALPGAGTNGITVNSVSLLPLAEAPQRAVLNLSIADNATPGPRVVTITNPDAGTATSSAFSIDAVAGRYTALTPARIFDSRTSIAFGPGETRDILVTGVGGVPDASQVSAVVMNVAVTGTTGNSFLTLHPAGTSRPLASNFNWAPGTTRSILATVKVGQGGRIAVFNNAGSAHVVFDVQGFYGVDPVVNATSDAGRFQPIQPYRLLDTRPSSALQPGEERKVAVSGTGGATGVPASGASAVALEVTVTEPTSDGFVTVWPAGAERPTTANVNFFRGQTVPNRVIAKLGSGSDLGKIALFVNDSASTHVVVDVVGWFTDSSPQTLAGAGVFHPLDPVRTLDSRTGTGGRLGKLGAGQSMDVPGTSAGGVPATGVSAVAVNVAVTEPTAVSFLTIYPAGAERPTTADLNYGPGETANNFALAKVGTDGLIGVFNNAGSTHVIFDVQGWYS